MKLVVHWLSSWRGLSFREGAGRLFRIGGDIFSILAVALVISTSFLLLLLDGYGEKHWLLAMLLYLPGSVWVLPALVLLPFCLLFCFRYAVMLILFVLGYAWMFMGYQFSTPVLDNRDGMVTLLSNNVGNNGKTTVDQFASIHEPDLMAFQEALPARFYREKYPERYVRSDGEFAFVSRFPIIEAGVVDKVRWGTVPVAARYVVELPSGGVLVVYNVHLPTRRFIMDGMRGKGLASAIFGGSRGYGSSIRKQNRDFFSGQIDLVERLIARAQSESSPTILCGDFNMPPHGVIYGLLSSAFDDAFEGLGHGYGYTFPGKTNNPLSFFRPWLRLDYAFTGKRIQAFFAEVEAERPSQHRALVVSCRVKD